MNKIRVLFITFVFIIASCTPSRNSTNTSATSGPDFGLRVFYYSQTPNTKFVVLKEHNAVVIANTILSSYNKDDLINALSLAYLQLPPNEQTYVNNAFKNTASLPYTFQQSLVIAVTSGDKINQDATLNSLKDLLIVAYRSMTPEEVQSRYYYGLTSMEQQVFKQRWNNFVQWYNQQQAKQQEEQDKQQQEQQTQSNQSGGFWRAFGLIVVGVIAGYAAYRASTYNSNVNSQLNQLQMQNTQMQWKINNIQTDLRRLAY